MKLTDQDRANIATAAQILERGNYVAFLRLIAHNKAAYDAAHPRKP